MWLRGACPSRPWSRIGATPAVRALCNLIDGQPTQPVDSVAVAECCALEALLDVPWREDLRPAA